MRNSNKESYQVKHDFFSNLQRFQAFAMIEAYQIGFAEKENDARIKSRHAGRPGMRGLVPLKRKPCPRHECQSR